MSAAPDVAADVAPRPIAEPVFAIITGGGTGGHVSPAIALAQELVQRGHARASIMFVGARGRLEADAVPEAGFTIELLPVRGLRFRATVENVRVLWDASRSLAAAVRLVRRARPQVVVGVGGYASLPCVAAARLLRIPTVVHEQNGAPGLANRIAVRLGARAAVSLPGTPLRGAVLTGNPVRRELVGLQRVPAEPPLVAVVGGSLGAGTLNDTALGLYDRWRDRTDVAVYHVAGPRNLAECERRLASLRRGSDVLRYDLVGYEHHIERVYERAAVAVCRAGASTVAELAAAGVPAVLVPLPGAPSDHQTRNAQSLAAAGAAIVVPDGECDAARIDELVRRMFADPAALREMGARAQALGRADAAARLADLVEEAAGVRT
ncbi:MAG: undecaprenyldiphospho-muramoylpentapeptide beta-N-acetylglucosaminyltransferase [Actinobacteria bacterium]|nr:undecaprenyldiphospho-muramoylpentapeptide beta-N-acetylglucosaminyltransferase [Actinomycetota bacterium]